MTPGDVALLVAPLVLALLLVAVVLLRVERRRRRLPPLRAEPMNFPGVPNVPVDQEERLERERAAGELEQKHVSTLDRARERRERRRRRK